MIRHGGYNKTQLSDKEVSAYKTMSFGTPVTGVDNAMVFHDPSLVLCLGKVHSYEVRKGYGWLMH